MALTSIEFASSNVLITKYWTDFKTIVSSKSLSMQYEYDGSTYFVYAVDNQIAYVSFIYNGTVPDPSNYSQVTNDADKADFIANYQSSANATTKFSSAVTQSGTWNVGLNAGANIIGAVTQSGTWNIGSITTLPAITGTVTANIGTTNGLALDTTLSTLSGKFGSLGQKAMTGSAPVVIASDQSAIPVSGTVTANVGTTNGLALDATLTGGTQTTQINNGANTAAVKAASTAAVAADPALVVAISPNNTLAVTVTQTDRTTSGTITNTQSVAINSQGTSTVNALVTGTWTGTLVFEGTVDGTNWNSISGDVPVTGADVTSTTANGTWSISSGGYLQVRVRGNTVATGTATVALNASVGIQAVSLDSPIPTGSNVIGAVTQSGTWNINAVTTLPAITGTVTANIGTTNGLALDATLTGGTQKTIIANASTTVGIKAASTAAVAADPALVVAISPNNTIAATQSGTWNIGSITTLPAITGTVTANIGTTNGLALDTTLSTLSGKFGTLGQKAMAGSAPVVIASDQSAVPVSGTVTANVGTTNGLALNATLTGGTATTRITDGTNTAVVKAASTAAVAADPSLVVQISPNTPALNTSIIEVPTFTCVAASVATGNAKSMLSILNTGSLKVRIVDIFLMNVSTAAQTGLYGIFSAKSITNHSAGTSLTTSVLSYDSADTLDAGITLRTGATLTGTSTSVYKRTIINTGNWTTTLNSISHNHSFEIYMPLISKPSMDSKQITLRTNQGLTLNFDSNNSTGIFDIQIIFTQQ